MLALQDEEFELQKKGFLLVYRVGTKEWPPVVLE